MYIVYVLVTLKIFKNILGILPHIKVLFLGLSFLIIWRKKTIITYLKILKFNSSFLFKYLIDIAVVDYPWKKNRFYITYIIRSLKFNRVISIYLKTPVYESVFSISLLYNSSFWVEREVWDFFGIFFLFHRNLKRIFTDYGFKGNPLRKDFPLVGFQEMCFDPIRGKLFYSDITV